MREIKIRVWSGDMWLDGGDALLHVKDKDSTNIELMAGHPLKEYIICQFTGLKDKNGKGIYEGDIVKFETGTCRQVIYQPPSFILKKRKADKTWTEFILAYTENQLETVIGNIYENPELLKK